MSVYFATLFCTYLLGIIGTINSRARTIKDDGQQFIIKRPLVLPFILAAGLLIAVSGLAKGMKDLYAYSLAFSQLPGDLSLAIAQRSGEPGWTLLAYIIKYYVLNDPQALLFTVALISNACVVYVIYRYSTLPALSLYLYVATGIFLWTMNGIRQFMIAALMFLCLRWIVRGKWLPFLLVVLLLSSIHRSALLMIPLYWVVRLQPWSRMTYLLISAFLVLVFAFDLIIPELAANIDGLWQTRYAETILATPGSNILRAALAFIPVVLSFYYRRKIAQMHNPLLNIAINFSLIYFFITVLALQASGNLISRTGIYAQLYTLLLIPYLIADVIPTRYRRFGYGVTMIVYLIFFIVQIFHGWTYYRSVLS
jgi:transmembrane protein EpsG